MILNLINQSLETDAEDLLTKVNLDENLNNKKLYILVFLYNDIIVKHHNNSLADYFDYNKILELLTRNIIIYSFRS